MRSLKIEAPFFGVAQRQSAWLLTRSSGVLISPLEPLRPEHWEVAQLAERRALDAEVAGSNPAFPAKFQGDGRAVRRWPLEPSQSGSTPDPPAIAGLV